MRDAAIAGVGVLGWLALTYGVARLTTPLVWPLSVGLLLVGAVGFRTVGHILWHGITTFLSKGRP